MRGKFLVVGHSIMDSRCYLKEFPKIDSMAILLKPIINSCGGSAANFSYNLSRIGVKARIASSTGKDNVGDFIKKSLKEEGVDTSSLRIFDGQSGRAIVLIDKKGNVKVIESLGVSDRYFKPKNSDFREIEYLHITGINKKVIQSFSKEGKKRGIKISIDLGRDKIKEGEKGLKSILKRSDFMFLNRKELFLFYNEKLNVKRVDSIKEKIKEINRKYGVKVIVKGGEKEVIAYDGKKHYIKKPLKVKVIDTIGAGDAFDSGFMAMYSKTNDFRKSLNFAMKIASIKIQRLGAQSLPKTKVRKLFNIYKKI